MQIVKTSDKVQEYQTKRRSQEAVLRPLIGHLYNRPDGTSVESLTGFGSPIDVIDYKYRKGMEINNWLSVTPLMEGDDEYLEWAKANFDGLHHTIIRNEAIQAKKAHGFYLDMAFNPETFEKLRNGAELGLKGYNFKQYKAHLPGKYKPREVFESSTGDDVLHEPIVEDLDFYIDRSMGKNDFTYYVITPDYAMIPFEYEEQAERACHQLAKEAGNHRAFVHKKWMKRD